MPAGTFFGLVGPNGAGKSTTLKMSTGLLRPDAGSIVVDGLNVWDNTRLVKERIGVVPEDLKLFERLTGRELLEYVGMLRLLSKIRGPASSRGTDPSPGPHRGGRPTRDRLLSRDAQEDRAWGPPSCTAPRSSSWTNRLNQWIRSAFSVIRSILEQLVEGGATVVFSSHVMEVVERLCDHVAVIHAGQVVASGATAAALRWPPPRRGLC